MINPTSTLLNALSMTLATKGIAEIVSGTRAAVVPIALPAISRVSGITMTIKITNGKLLKILTRISKIV